jgi:hypothetical protein
MAVIREIRTLWLLPTGSNHVSVMYFDSATAVASQRTALQTFWTAVKALQSNVCSYTIDTAGRELDDATGTLTGSWSEGSAKTGTGANGGPQVADATQGLIQWRTGTIVNGRFVRGRTFVPCIASSQEIGGNLASASVTALQSAANALIAAGVGLKVWHRPIAGSGGSAPAVGTASIWTEFAVLRRRRA